MTTHRAILIATATVATLLTVGTFAGSPGTLADAHRQFEKHNYKAALEILVALPQPEDASAALPINLLRARCQIKLRPTQEQLESFSKLLDAQPSTANDPSLHEELADTARRRRKHHHLAIRHYRTAHDLYLKRPDIRQTDAARTAIACAELLSRFDQFDLLPGWVESPPSDWQERRKLQLKLASEWFDRGVALTDDDLPAADALLQKARLHEQHLYHNTENIKQVIAMFRDVVERAPRSHAAAQADHRVAQMFNHRQNDYVNAAKQYRTVIERYKGSDVASQAKNELDQIISPIITIWTDTQTPVGQRATIHYRVRNIAEMKLRAWSVDLFDLAREQDSLWSLENWQANGQPVVHWTVDIPDDQTHQWYDSNDEKRTPTSLPVTEPGAYIVQAGNDGIAVARTLVIVSDLALITKTGANQTLIWSTNAKTGKPVTDVELLLQGRNGPQTWTRKSTITLDNGQVSIDRASHKNGRMQRVFARLGQHYATSNAAGGWSWSSQQKGLFVYTFTDRPIYRPGDTVRYKHIVRSYRTGHYETNGKTTLPMTVYDPVGQEVFNRSISTDNQGIAVGEFTLPTDTALGLHRFRIQHNGRHIDIGSGGTYRVEEYRKPEFEVTIEPVGVEPAFDRPTEIRISANYLFGSPLANAPTRVTIHRVPIRERIWYPYGCYSYFRQLAPMMRRGRSGLYWWPVHQQRDLVLQAELTTDTEGVAILQFIPAIPTNETDQKNLGYRFDIEAEASDPSRRVVTGSGSISVTHIPFSIRMTPQRWVYQPGDRVHIDVESTDANGEPVAFTGTVHIHELVPADAEKDTPNKSETYEPGRRIASETITADASGQTIIRRVFENEGHYRFMINSEKDGRTVTKSCNVWLAKRNGSLARHAWRDIEIVLDRSSYNVGDTANILLTSQRENGHVLLTIEADGWIDEQVVALTNGSAIVDLPITARHTPNFFVTATMVREFVVYQDMMPVVVPPIDRFLNVSIDGLSETYTPQQNVSATLNITDADGQPVRAEAAVMIVDKSLYTIQPELRSKISEYFYGRVRNQGVQTHTSFASPGGARRGGRGGSFAQRELVVGGDAIALAAPVAKSSAAAQSANGSFALPEIRSQFPDALKWIARIRTDANGQADFQFTVPDTLTTWRLTAIAIDDDTRVGESKSKIITRKNIIARLQTPRFLVEQDRCFVSVIARNDLDDRKQLRVSLTSTGPVNIRGAFIDGEPIELTDDHAVIVDANPRTEAIVDFELIATDAGSATLTAAVAADVEADAIRKNLPVLTYGSQTLLTESGTMRDFDADETRTVTLVLPDKMDPTTPVLEVQFRPTIAGVLIDAIPYLVEYPYGCTEQTMSRFMPAVLTRQSLKTLGVKLDQLEALANHDPTDPRHPDRRRNNPVFDQSTLDDVIGAGIERLTKLQRPDGGWGWWRTGSADPYMTAYVVQGLAEGRQAGVTFDETILDRGFEFLNRRLLRSTVAEDNWYRQSRQREINTRVWMLFALSYSPKHRTSPNVRTSLDSLFDQRDDLSDYGRAMLAMVLDRIGNRQRAETVIANLHNTAVREGDDVHWGQHDGYHRWYRDGIETTAMALRAMLAVAPNHESVPLAANWLVKSRQASRWQSTKATALAIHALSAWLEQSRELDANMKLTITIDDKLKRTFEITPDNILSADTRMIVAPRHLTPGSHTVRIEKVGKGNLYYAAFADFFTRQDPIPPAGRDITVTRNYHLLTPKTVPKTRRIWDATQRKMIDQSYDALDYDRAPIEAGQPIPAGSMIEVTLSVHSTNDFDYILIEDPKPAGFEPANLHSGYNSDGGGYAHREFRDHHVAFFLNHLQPGNRTFSYRLRSENAGEFRILPTRVEAMYSPYLRANSASQTLVTASSGQELRIEARTQPGVSSQP